MPRLAKPAPASLDKARSVDKRRTGNNARPERGGDGAGSPSGFSSSLSSRTRIAPSGFSSRWAGRGYFILRTLSGIANAMAWSFVLHTALLTATGYSITLLMAAAYRRLIRLKPVDHLAGDSIVLVIVAAGRLLGDRDLEPRHLRPARRAAGGDTIPRRDPAHLHSARRLVGALLQHQLLSAAREADRPAAAARESGELGASWRCCATSSIRISCSTR